MNKILTIKEYNELLKKNQQQDELIQDLFEEIKVLKEKLPSSTVGQVYVYDKEQGKAVLKTRDNKGA